MERILLIEDDPGTQLLFLNRLREFGYEVVTASTGARGLLEARAGKFDLFLVDIGLGSGIDGYEVCRRLKGVPQIHSIPVVLISGQVKSQEELHRGYEAGCQSFLVKGDLTLVEDVVRAMLRIKSLQDELALQNRLLEERHRHLQKERERGADLEVALRESGSRALVFRELATGHPDGVLLVDTEGVVRMTDRGAQEILGKDIEGKHLASIARGTGLEAFVRNARTQPHESCRFDLEWANGSVRSLSASVLPTVPSSVDGEPPYRVVLLVDATKRRLAGEMLRMDDTGLARRELGVLLEAAHEQFRPSAILGDSPPMQDFRQRVDEAARREGNVYLTGPQGSGKGLAARCIHYGGGSRGAFLSVNCTSLAPEVMERELFGYAKGAFPEAIAAHPGLLQRALGGTLYLSEIGSLSSELQQKLAKALSETQVVRLGAEQAEAIDLRMIASSIEDPQHLIDTGKLERELFDQLDSSPVATPELSKGHPDTQAIARRFVERFGAAKNLELSSEAAWVVSEHSWPGNVGELEKAMELACENADGPEVEVSDLGPPLYELYRRMSESDAIPVHAKRIGESEKHERKADPLAEAYLSIEVVEESPSLEAYERRAILHALRETNGDKLKAAKLLKIGKSTFYRKLKTHGLS